MGKIYDYLYKKEPGLLREVHEVMEPAIKLLSEEFEERLTMQQERMDEINTQLTQKSEELVQNREQLVQHIKNYIYLCKEEGKTVSHTEQTLQKIFSLTLVDAKEMLSKYW